jgi:energy-coupling factor transport system permease protein
VTHAALLPRHLHPGAWWLWALGLATAASRTTNPLLLALVIAVSGYVVAARRSQTPWARSYAAFLRLGLAVIVLRVAFQTLFGATDSGSHVLVTLPEFPLPDWVAGIRVGGPVTVEGLLLAAYDGLRLAAVLVCVGAANSLANPKRLLRLVPGALYEAGVTVIVALTVAPQIVAEVGRVRAARRLRGRADRGIRGLGGVLMPVLEGSLERSLELAAAMDSRGYGRGADRSPGLRRATAALVLGGLLGVCAGVYGLLDGGDRPLLGLPLLGLGVAAAAGGLALGSRRTARTRYRPDPWLHPEWLVAGIGLVTAAALIATGVAAPASLYPAVVPLEVPSLPVLPTMAILLGLAPAWLSPPPPALRRTGPPPRRAAGAPAEVAI